MVQEIPLFMSVDECADILHLNTKAVYRLIRTKRLRAKKLGKQWRIMRDHLLKFFEA